MRILALTTLAALAACAPAEPVAEQEAAEETEYAGRTTGESTSCVQQRDVDRIEAVDDNTLLFFMRGGTIYQNKLGTSCPRFEDSIANYRSTLGNYCRGETFTLTDRMTGMFTGSCQLGDFMEYELAEDEEGGTA